MVFPHQKAMSWAKVDSSFFWLVCGVMFLYQFFPTYIFTILSVGNWFCLIAPDNVPLNQILGTQSGVGLLPLTFDWNQITYVINPLTAPWWVQVHTCPDFKVFGTASEIWGLIGPKLLFNPGRTYNHLLYGFLVGALSPVPFWLIAKRYPNSQWRLVNMPVMFI